MRTPSRDSTGIALLYEYYNQLYYFERRFFSPEKGLGVFFDWWVFLLDFPYCEIRTRRLASCEIFGAVFRASAERICRSFGGNWALKTVADAAQCPVVLALKTGA